MERYSEDIEARMLGLFESLSEKDSRRYAAIEAEKLGHGGIKYIAELFGCDEKTVERGRKDLDRFPNDEAGEGIRKKGVAASQLALRNQLLSKQRKRRLKRKLPVHP